MTVDLSTYKTLYLQTAREYVDKLLATLEHIENEGDKEAIDTAHIAAHSLKSQSLVMGYKQTGTLSGGMETFFNSVKKQEKQIVPSQIQIIRELTARVAESLNSIETSNTELDLSQDIEKMKQLS